MSDAKLTWMDLARFMGPDRFKTELPAPFYGYVCAHSTGCQAYIRAKADGHVAVEVWRDSVWDSSIYEFNERGKVRGIQPGCEFAIATLSEFFARIADEMRAAERKLNDAKLARDAAESNAKSSALAHYATLVAASPSTTGSA